MPFRRGAASESILRPELTALYAVARPGKNVYRELKHPVFDDRYPALDRKHALHRAMEIMEYMDDDCSGGVSFDEFEKFCGV